MSGRLSSRRIHAGLLVSSLAFAGLACFLFYGFTADDAFIVARYAVNARDLGEWAFNAGEHVTAMTSPLHGMLMVGLSYLEPDPVHLYKFIAALLMIASCSYCVKAFGIERKATPLLVAILVGPNIILWTFGGLETPLLTSIITMQATIYCTMKPGDERTLLILGILAGLAVLTRYDAILFAGPLLLAGLIQTRWRWGARATAIVAAGAPVVAWFLYSWHQFGTILPSSFYVKAPSANPTVLVTNLQYIGEQLAIGGVLTVAVYVTARLRRSRGVTATLWDEILARWGLHLGILAMLMYGASVATTHMMFAFRYFVPYLPATALVLLCLLVRIEERARASDAAPRPQRGLVLAVLAILLVHGFQAEAVYNRSLQGLGSLGEYEAQGAAGYARDFVPAMQQNARDARTHWARLNKGRPPRIWTFAAGVLPYTYREAYIFEDLVSFRHNCSREWKVSADYIHVFTRHGALSRQLIRLEPNDLSIVSKVDIHYNGVDESLLVYYNRAPLPNQIPAWADQPCLPESR